MDREALAPHWILSNRKWLESYVVRTIRTELRLTAIEDPLRERMTLCHSELGVAGIDS